MGPLICTDVTANSCKLQWLPPEDDGGKPVLEYEIEKLDPKTKRWIKIGKVSGDKRPLTFDVKGLEEGMEYEFRVTAISEEGESDPLLTDCAIKAKNPFDKPSKPGKPEIVDYDEKSVDLIWTPPASDGGAQITHYIIQKKLFGGDDGWEKCGTHETRTGKEELKTTISRDLKYKKKYQFRVIAVNKGGESPPSDPSEPHLVKHKKLAPIIDRTNLVTTTVRIGKQIYLDVDVQGEPVPDIEWFLDGKEITTNDKITVENTENNTKFTIKSGRRSQTGKYKIVATNKHGEDHAFVDLVFLGPPSKPMGPLEVHDLTKNSCRLKWKVPEDDGGKPILGYVIEKMDKDNGRWVPAGRTDADTLEFPVKGLQEGHEYMFRVKAINDEGESEPLETEAAIKAKDPFERPSPPKNVRFVDWDADRMDIEWDVPDSDGGAKITHYIVEMKIGKPGESWTEVGSSDGPKRFFSKKELTKGEKYQFR
eukprot:maker-scaffold401_size182380-snap-gene-0.20 protein:Tk02138 transcript:maker-scaffold401_size182380-snap-gene-0.20-mRNA-1 annotation:"GM26811"